MSNHQIFADSLLSTKTACPAGLTTWNQSDPARRFAVYRNNVMVSLIDALADACPVTQALVGEEFFRAMAAVFARANPPLSPVMAYYGAGFSDFIERFPAAAELPYLADVARLEMLRVHAYHAADAMAIAPDEISRLLEDPERLPEARFKLQPSLRILSSPHAAVSLWAAHQDEDVGLALKRVETTQPESALVVRVGLDVEITRISAGAAVFIRCLAEGLGLDPASARAMEVDAGFDLAGTLGLLLRSDAITGVAP